MMLIKVSALDTISDMGIHLDIIRRATRIARIHESREYTEFQQTMATSSERAVKQTCKILGVSRLTMLTAVRTVRRWNKKINGDALKNWHMRLQESTAERLLEDSEHLYHDERGF